MIVELETDFIEYNVIDSSVITKGGISDITFNVC